jgi:polar amino acid transport system ATP-binding protein
MQIEISGLTKRFGDATVLDELALSTHDVGALVLIGPSGGGKSTLLRILAGLEQPEAGTLSVDGRPIVFDERSLLAHRRRVGTVFQSFNLFPHLTALENITLPLVKVHGWTAADAEQTAMTLLEGFKLEEHAAKKPGQLSGGQKQRVAIVRAVAIKPDFLLFDEPTSALDPEMTAEVLDTIRRLRDEDRHLVLVTHHLAFARTVADYVAFLADGRIVESGPAAQVFNRPATDACRRFLDTVLRY